MTFGSANLDTTVSQVNAQIGTLMRRDLGLGLLFVTGKVTSVTYGDGLRLTGFVLEDGDSELRADLAPSFRNPPAVQAGLSVRVTALEEQRKKVAQALHKIGECRHCLHSPVAENNFCEPCTTTGERLPEHLSALYQ